MRLEFAVFETALGPCAIIWGEAGILGVQLPEGSVEATRARVLRRHPDASPGRPPANVEQARQGIVSLMAGEAADLTGAALDLANVPEFDRRVYEVARTIPPGATLTYGDIAGRLGQPETARDVGQALGSNPFPIIVPCHRVVAAGGRLGGFSAHGGIDAKRRLLSIEGAHTRIGLFKDSHP